MSYVMQAARGPDFQAGGDDPRAEAFQPASIERVSAEPDKFVLVRADQAERIPNEARDYGMEKRSGTAGLGVCPSGGATPIP